MRYFFRVEYDGTNYGGWQQQPNAVTIQETLQKAFSIAMRQPIAITGAGRTDAGVHARAQGAHFDVDGLTDLRRCEMSVNALLPPDIAVYAMQRVDATFHARYAAISRCYKYYFCFRKKPLHHKRCWKLDWAVDWDMIRRNIAFLRGKHDFSSFKAAGSSTENSVCTISYVSLEPQDDFLVFTIQANRFIYKMVRSIVGTLIDIGRGKCTMQLDEIVAGKDRSCAGFTAPPSGLVLEHVQYREVE